MKSFAFLFVLILCTACVPQGLPVTEASPPPVATHFPIATISPTSTSFPSSTTPALLLPSPTPIFNILIDKVAVDQQGALYVSGFGKQDDLRHFARWDGGKWITIADQLGGEAPAVYDMAVGRNGHLYIGGSFETVNTIPARHIACWDGNSWLALGDGVNERVNALAFDPNGQLYAVGYFTEAGACPWTMRHDGMGRHGMH